jgi:hypothetical protein
MQPEGEPQVLRPFHRSEAITIAEAAIVAGRSPRTVRQWCLLNDLGRKVGGQWLVSRPALMMWLDADKAALKAYLGGDRNSPAVTDYFARFGVPLPKQRYGVREAPLSELNGATSHDRS